ncbi:glycosyltransferase [Flavobacterium sp.]|uniref:glycosyltransferase n=1 Tax=Flavobacterium sp. TaxID=239 RepID=UPI003D13FA7A
MKILLVGEYSRLHNSLKEGLIALGHEVHIKGLNDGFKNYPVDFKITRPLQTGILKYVKLALYKVTKFDLASLITYLVFKKNSNEFKGYDVVQLINENAFLCAPYFEKKILNTIFNNNKKTFLLSTGDDYISNNFYYNNPKLISIFTPYFEKKIPKKGFIGSLKYLEKEYKNLHHFITTNIQGIISSDLDYHIPMQASGCKKYLGMVANPINLDQIQYIENRVEGKIKIFIGINSNTYYKKGIDIFEKILDRIELKYKDQIEIIKASNLPYQDYINLYNSSHILLDQMHANDQGYNALEAMAKGKVVFTGASPIFEKHYQLQKTVAIHAVPDIELMVQQLSTLIENPHLIDEIGKQARTFIYKEHNYIQSAEKYLALWTL